jgi:hypothetical protein
MAAPTNAANVKKALANSEPSTHGTFETCRPFQKMSVVRRDLVYVASATGSLYRSPLTIMAQTIRASLLASAMASSGCQSSASYLRRSPSRTPTKNATATASHRRAPTQRSRKIAEPINESGQQMRKRFKAAEGILASIASMRVVASNREFGQPTLRTAQHKLASMRSRSNWNGRLPQSVIRVVSTSGWPLPVCLDERRTNAAREIARGAVGDPSGGRFYLAFDLNHLQTRWPMSPRQFRINGSRSCTSSNRLFLPLCQGSGLAPA